MHALFCVVCQYLCDVILIVLFFALLDVRRSFVSFCVRAGVVVLGEGRLPGSGECGPSASTSTANPRLSGTVRRRNGGSN